MKEEEPIYYSTWTATTDYEIIPNPNRAWWQFWKPTHLVVKSSNTEHKDG